MARFLLLVTLCFLVPVGAPAQIRPEVDVEMLQSVMPSALGFSEKLGEPLVYTAFGAGADGPAETEIGYVFLTSDVPPEEYGYSGKIEVLVGMDLTGRITGVKVVHYREALQSSYGDFLRRPGIQEQFSGKHIAEAFRAYRDVAGISGATISASAMYRGIRNSARRIALAYLRDRQPARPARGDGTASTILEDLEDLTWLEMLSTGLVARMEVVQYDALILDLTFSYMGDERLGNLLLGPETYAAVQEQVREWGGDGHLMFLGLDGSFVAAFRRYALTVQQGGESFPVARNRIMHWGRPAEGKAAEQVFYSWIMVIDPAIDLSQPVTFVYDDGRVGPYSTEFSIPEDVQAALRARSAPAAVVASNPNPPDENGVGAVGVEAVDDARGENRSEAEGGAGTEDPPPGSAESEDETESTDGAEPSDAGAVLPAPAAAAGDPSRLRFFELGGLPGLRRGDGLGQDGGPNPMGSGVDHGPAVRTRAVRVLHQGRGGALGDPWGDPPLLGLRRWRFSLRLAHRKRILGGARLLLERPHRAHDGRLHARHDASVGKGLLWILVSVRGAAGLPRKGGSTAVPEKRAGTHP